MTIDMNPIVMCRLMCLSLGRPKVAFSSIVQIQLWKHVLQITRRTIHNCPEAFFLFSGFPSSPVSITTLVIKNTSSLHVIHHILRYSLGHNRMLLHSSFSSWDMANTFHKETWRYIKNRCRLLYGSYYIYIYILYILGNSRQSWTILGSFWDPLWTHLGLSWAVFGAISSNLKQSWSILGSFWDRFWAILSNFEAILGASSKWEFFRKF